MSAPVYRARRFKDSSVLEIFRLLWKDRAARFAMIYFLLFVALAVLSFFWPHDYRTQDLAASRQSPSFEYWFGTDLIGRDMFTRVLYAARITVILTFMTLLFVPISIIIGVSAGYFGGKVDAIVMFFGKLSIGIPSLLFVLLIRATLMERYDSFLFGLGSFGEWSIRTGLADLMVIFLVTSLVFWIGGARMYRSQVIALRTSPLVENARMLGAGHKRIIVHHLIPQLHPYIAHNAFLSVAGVIGTEIALSFFGIGIRAPHPSFGAMFSESASVQLLQSTPHLLVWPAIIVGLYFYSVLFLDQRVVAILASAYEREESA